jgi:hypothetical protein
MSEIRGSVAQTVEADPRALFSVITDINRLPEWNEIIQQVVD